MSSQAAAESAAKADQKRAAHAAKGRFALGLAGKSPANEAFLREEKLRNRIAAMQAGLNAPDQDAAQQNQISVAIEATSNALGGLINRKSRIVALDRLEIQIQNERNPLLRAEMQARQTKLRLSDREITSDKLAFEMSRARNRALGQAIASAGAQGAEMRSALEIRQRLNSLVATGVITAGDANRTLQEELQLRPLITASVLAEGREKQRLLEVIEQLKSGYAGLANEQKRAAGLEVLRGHKETLERLRVEAALLGENATKRAKLLALLKAEMDIRRIGIDTNGEQAAAIRASALHNAGLAREIEKQAEAWGKVQSAAEGAIDTMTDDLLKGDFSGALESLSSEITGLFAEIAIKNPLKNALLGTDLGTIGDIGGLKGIFDRLTGRGGESTIRTSSKSMGVGSMTVSAASVIINGGGSGLLGAGGAPSGSGKLGGSGDVQKQVWDFFKTKGLKPHQIAGIMGNVSAESAFDPLAKGDAGKAFGLFQHNDRSSKLFSHLGGAGNLGNVQGQLEFAWKELMSSENGAMKRLMASTDVRGATGAFAGFERPQGWSMGNPEGSHGWAKRLGGAEAALSKFGRTTETATLDLGNLGTGFEGFGSFLSKLGQGGGGGGGGGFLNMLLTGIGGAIGLPGFMVGGATGGSDPTRVAGLVHEEEYVFDAAATSRIGVPLLEAMRKGKLRGFREGGFATSLPAFPQVANQQGGSAQPMSFVVHNYSGQPVQKEEKTDASGARQMVMTIGEHVAAAVAQPGNPLRAQLGASFNLKPAGIVR